MRFLFMTIVLISSCAHNVRLVKNVPQEEVTNDDAQCRAQAMNIQTSDYEYRGTFMEGAMIKNKQNEVYQYCMIGKGYRIEQNSGH